jgi:hypothetical protein
MSRPATSKLKVNPIVGSLPVLQYCAPEQLLIDETYQRSLEVESSQTLIRRIAMYWDWGLCQPLFVARRADGGLYVVDGQHRLAAALLRGDVHQLPCVVSHFDDAKQEAAAFVALNQQRRPLNALDLFKAALAAGDMEACQVVQCLQDAGLRIASTTNLMAIKPGAVANVGGLQRCYRTYGIQVLSASLQVLARAYPQQVLRYAGSIFPGIVAVVAGELNNRTAPESLVEKLAEHIGHEAQHAWYRRFALAIVDDPNLTRARAAERVVRASWVERSKVQIGTSAAPASQSARVTVPLNEQAWCKQCDRRVSGEHAARCTSPFCSLKAKAA